MTEVQFGTERDSQALPEGWVLISLQELGEINPRFDSSELPENLDVTFLPMKNVQELSGEIDVSNVRPLSEVRRSYTPFKEGDIIFAKITPCMENGKIAVANRLKNGLGFGSSEFHIIRLHKLLPRKFVFYFLIQEDFRREAERNMTGSAGQRRVPTNYIKQAIVPLPPLNEQRRIVEKIEELFARLDAGVRALEQARGLLKKYRQSVLKAAVTGELSREWREAHRDELEPASELLERILEERREKWPGKRYREPETPDTSNLPELPEGWVWASLSQFVKEPLRNGHSAKAVESGGVRTLTLTAVTVGDFSEANTKLTDVNPARVSDLWLEPGDILIERSNTPDLVGTARLYRGERHFAIFPDLIIRARILSSIPAIYVELVLQSPHTRLYFKGSAQGISGSMPKISQSTVEVTPIPLPPQREISFIVEEVERLLSVADNLEATIEESLKRAGALRQSILRWAFSGRLVPQDPNDEPASVLLERIREERKRRAASGKRKRGGGRRRRKGAPTEEPRLFSGEG